MGSGGGVQQVNQRYTITAVSDANYTVAPGDQIIEYITLTAPRTVTLPPPSPANNGQFITVKDTTGSAGIDNITISGTINGIAATEVINVARATIRLFSDGTSWYVVQGQLGYRDVIPVQFTQFLTAGDITMTLANTFYTAVAAPSTLAAGRGYLLSGSVLLQAAVGETTFTVELFDLTNSVVVWNGEVTAPATAGKNLLVSIPFVNYSGYAGTPSIIIHVEANTAGNFIKTSAGGAGAGIHLSTMLQAISLS